MNDEVKKLIRFATEKVYFKATEPPKNEWADAQEQEVHIGFCQTEAVSMRDEEAEADEEFQAKMEVWLEQHGLKVVPKEVIAPVVMADEIPLCLSSTPRGLTALAPLGGPRMGCAAWQADSEGWDG